MTRIMIAYVQILSKILPNNPKLLYMRISPVTAIEFLTQREEQYSIVHTTRLKKIIFTFVDLS